MRGFSFSCQRGCPVGSLARRDSHPISLCAIHAIDVSRCFPSDSSQRGRDATRAQRTILDSRLSLAEARRRNDRGKRRPCVRLGVYASHFLSQMQKRLAFSVCFRARARARGGTPAFRERCRVARRLPRRPGTLKGYSSP